MKKNILIILTAIAIVFTIFSSLLCFMQNAELTSMGIKIDEKLASLEFGEKLLRHPTALSYVNFLLDNEKMVSYIKAFDVMESFSFPMRFGMVIWFSLASVIHSVLFPVLSILLFVLYFKKKSVFTLKLSHIIASAGALFTLLPFTLSFAIQQNIYETAAFKFNLINPYIILAVEAVYLIVTVIVINRLKISDKYAPVISYSQAAYEVGGVKYSEEAPVKKAKGFKKASKKTETES